MHEPAPDKLSPPTSEPTIRVGIVLVEDQLKSLAISSPAGIIAGDLSFDSAQITALEDNKISLGFLDRTRSFDRLVLKSKIQTSLAIGHGIKVNPVVAGRKFHWRKEIEAIFPGDLEVRCIDGVLQIINDVKFEDYLARVVTSEMGALCPVEFMKAQLTAARSWAYVFLRNKHPNEDFDVCNDDDCQRYQGTTFLSSAAIEASLTTKGKFITFESKTRSSPYVVPAYYYKTCGGITENSLDIFGFDEPSLSTVHDCDNSIEAISLENFIDIDTTSAKQFYCGQAPDISKYLGKVDEGGAHFRWTRKVTLSDLLDNLSNKYNLSDVQEIKELKSLKWTKSSRITQLQVKYISKDGTEKSFLLDSQYKIREALSPTFLPSSAFLYELESDGSISFRGAGWGHGVGLCQVGGVMMALAGKNFVEILTHYFPKSILTTSYS